MKLAENGAVTNQPTQPTTLANIPELERTA
jgi:hypothetical protein